MIVCELCTHSWEEGKCRLDLKIPKGITCRDYNPGMHKFCADPKDFVDASQIVEIAKYFGLKGTELKKVKVMANQAEAARL